MTRTSGSSNGSDEWSRKNIDGVGLDAPWNWRGARRHPIRSEDPLSLSALPTTRLNLAAIMHEIADLLLGETPDTRGEGDEAV